MLSGKPCSCGGNNENCYKCDGTGFYSLDKKPSGPDGILVFMGGISGEMRHGGKGKSPKRKPTTDVECPVCKIKLSPEHLSNHQQYEHTKMYQVVAPRLMVVAKVAKPKGGSNCIRNQCDVCGRGFETIENLNYHWLSHGKTRRSQEDEDYAGLSRRERSLGNGVLSNHSKNAAVPKQLGANKVQSRAQGSTKKALPKTQVKTPTQRIVHPQGPQNPVITYPRSESRFDATLDYSENFREGGRWGSHPSHDDYSDEGMS